jgi:hypothetical protein
MRRVVGLAVAPMRSSALDQQGRTGDRDGGSTFSAAHRQRTAVSSHRH